MGTRVVGTLLSTAWLVTVWVSPGTAEDGKLPGEGGRLEERPSIERREGTRLPFDERERAFQWPFTLDLRSAVEYDNNVKLEDGAEDKDDMRVVFGADARVPLPRFWDVGTTINYSFYKDAYLELEEYDLEGHTIGAGLDRAFMDTLHAYLDYSWSIYFFDGRRYVRRHSVSSALYVSHGETFSTLVRASWDSNDYTPENVDGLSGDDYAVSVRELVSFGRQRKRNLWVEYRGNYDNARHSYESYVGHRAEVGFRTPLWWQVSGQVSLSYGRGDYRDEDPNYGNRERRDDVYVAGVALDRPLFVKFVIGRLYYTFTEQRSNIGPRDYSDNLTGLELEARF